MCVREMFTSSNEGETERIGIRARQFNFFSWFLSNKPLLFPALLTHSANNSTSYY